MARAVRGPLFASSISLLYLRCPNPVTLHREVHSHGICTTGRSVIASFHISELIFNKLCKDEFWLPLPGALDAEGGQLYGCTLCNDRKPHKRSYKRTHEGGLVHQSLLEELRYSRAAQHTGQPSPHADLHAAQREVVDESIRELLASLSRSGPIPPGAGSASADEGSGTAPSGHGVAPTPSVINWSLFEGNENTHLTNTWEQNITQTVARELEAQFNAPSDDGEEERASEHVDEGLWREPEVTGMCISCSFVCTGY